MLKLFSDIIFSAAEMILCTEQVRHTDISFQIGRKKKMLVKKTNTES